MQAMLPAEILYSRTEMFKFSGFKIWKNKGKGRIGNVSCQIYNISFSTTPNRYQHMPKFNDNREENNSCFVGSSQVINEVFSSRIVEKILVPGKIC
ncbi:hypothetical protein GWI33_007341 [Rhynchophorus ferrugineus]|uniref:Uncharacterized protein n=1 Tax=Rhynchophorus ferrugineus TaxID=354439 RepID=A0A834IJ08_RHYFE|nr:hypothetical protein GWI33_007341 [Rhynchophorus ferrugineus]